VSRLLIYGILAVFLFSSCYEGYDRKVYQGPEQKPPPQPIIKPIHYILFQPVMMNSQAIDADECLAEESIRVFKANEWAARVAQLNSAMAEIAETFVYQPILVSRSDCQQMNAVLVAALDSEPWGDEKPPEQDPLERYAFHIKGGFWEEEPATSPPEVVRSEHWGAFQDFADKGRTVKSLHYYVVSNANDGYFFEWQESQREAVVLSGTPIDAVDPTETGIRARVNAITADTKALVAWLLSQLI
jgi:hypothetical protein